MVDLSLPDMSGWAVALKLRATQGLEHMKIMIISANAHEHSTSSGALHDAFLVKPVDLQALLEKTAHLLDLTWIRDADSAKADTEPAPAATNLSGRSRRHLEDLYRLGRIGHVRGIEAKLREIELEDPVNEAFAGQLRTLVSNFDLKRYMSVLESLRVDT
jgi:response regulator RpfG family c-di-GMP phosphodiesterase